MYSSMLTLNLLYVHIPCCKQEAELQPSRLDDLEEYH